MALTNTTGAGTRTQFDIARERAGAESERQRKLREDAFKRRLTAQGIGDSGIQEKGIQTIGTESRRSLAERRGLIDIEEAQQKERQAEAAKEREFLTEQSQLGREFQTGERVGSQQFAGEQAQLGREFRTGEREATQQFAGEQAELGREFQRDLQTTQLQQSFDLASRGLNLEESRIALSRQNLDQTDQHFYANLGQARWLAEQQLDNNAIQLALQEKGMNQQNAQFFAGLAQQKELVDIQQAYQTFRDQTLADIQTDLTILQNDLIEGRMNLATFLERETADMNQEDAIKFTLLSSIISSYKPKDDAEFRNTIAQLGESLGVPDLLNVVEQRPDRTLTQSTAQPGTQSPGAVGFPGIAPPS
jgi:hypothetical protein